MEFDDEKLAAVRDIMKQAFPGAELTVRNDPSLQCQVFSAQLKGSVYTAMVRYDFLEHQEPAEILEKIRTFLLIEHLKDMPGTPFVVTREGLELRRP